ncbi:MAG: hypothetical protein AAFR79_13485 [Pseudomonadota bacterium]
MARHHGKNGVVTVGASNLECLRSWTFTETAALADATCAGDTHEVYVDGIKSGRGTIEVVFDDAGTVQPTFVAGATLSVELYKTASDHIAMSIILEERTTGTSHTAEVTQSWSFRSSGAVTYTGL